MKCIESWHVLKNLSHFCQLYVVRTAYIRFIGDLVSKPLLVDWKTLIEFTAALLSDNKISIWGVTEQFDKNGTQLLLLGHKIIEYSHGQSREMEEIIRRHFICVTKNERTRICSADANWYCLALLQCQLRNNIYHSYTYKPIYRFFCPQSQYFSPSVFLCVHRLFGAKWNESSTHQKILYIIRTFHSHVFCSFHIYIEFVFFLLKFWTYRGHG